MCIVCVFILYRRKTVNFLNALQTVMNFVYTGNNSVQVCRFIVGTASILKRGGRYCNKESSFWKLSYKSKKKCINVGKVDITLIFLKEDRKNYYMEILELYEE